MVKRECKCGKFVCIVLYWAIYLTLTMVLFEHLGIVPQNIPRGVVGWGVIVELPRAIIGFLISLIFLKYEMK